MIEEAGKVDPEKSDDEGWDVMLCGGKGHSNEAVEE